MQIELFHFDPNVLWTYCPDQIHHPHQAQFCDDSSVTERSGLLLPLHRLWGVPKFWSGDEMGLNDADWVVSFWSKCALNILSWPDSPSSSNVFGHETISSRFLQFWRSYPDTLLISTHQSNFLEVKQILRQSFFCSQVINCVTETFQVLPILMNKIFPVITTKCKLWNRSLAPTPQTVRCSRILIWASDSMVGIRVNEKERKRRALWKSIQGMDFCVRRARAPTSLW